MGPRWRASSVAVSAVVVSCVIEAVQATGALAALARVVPPARWVFGTGFAWLDLVAYVAGGPLAYAVLSPLRGASSAPAR